MKTITKIDRKPLRNEQSRRVAAYCRVSSDTDVLKHSLATQIGYYTRLIAQNPGWEFVGIYADDGITGTSMKHRDQFQRLIQDCEEGKIDLVLTKSIQRFSRNTVDLLSVTRQLKAIGVEVRFVKENISTANSDGELMLSILGSFAQAESESISSNIRWSLKKQFKDGIIRPQNRAYGYQWIEDEMFICEQEAKVVKQIFSLFLKGRTPNWIAKNLNESGSTTRLGKPWTCASIQYILKNEIYTGQLKRQKYYTPEGALHKTKKNDGIITAYVIEDNHPAIIDPKDWDLAQQKLQEKSARRKKPGKIRRKRSA